MPHQLLDDPDIVAGMGQERTIGMAKGVPSDPFYDPRLSCGWLEDLAPEAIRPDRKFPELLQAGEYPITCLRKPGFKERS